MTSHVLRTAIAVLFTFAFTCTAACRGSPHQPNTADQAIVKNSDPSNDGAATQQTAQNLCSLFGRAGAIVPAFKSGSVVGVKMFSIRHGAFAERVGLRNRDTLLLLNGVSLTARASSAAAVETALGDCTALTLDIVRDGRPLRLVHVESADARFAD